MRLPLAKAVLFDRDHTITIDDPPFNGDPRAVRPVPGAREAVARLRAEGIGVGVVTNQSGVGLGLLTRAEVEAVNQRVDELVGPFDTWQYCPHTAVQECSCRKPAPGMILSACDALGVPPQAAIVVGDTVWDVAAAESAGATGILIPTERTLPSERRRVSHVCPDLGSAVDLILGCRQVVVA